MRRRSLLVAALVLPLLLFIIWGIVDISRAFHLGLARGTAAAAR